ncbi:MAG TPA: alpha/beta hydrolase [Pseudonocardia sp.]|nr:alpha/beta hydrolase [Pseudonocardia sp.]
MLPLRDLLRELELGPVSVVGHSFGGGVAMSFGYQFPERTDRLGLISSGGLGAELTLALRAASVPGALRAAHAVTALSPRWLRQLARHAVTELGLAPGADVDAVAKALRGIAEPAAREAFLRTLRGAVGWSGQRLGAVDRFGLLGAQPVLLITGRRDTCIPYQHTVRAHAQLPGSRLEVLDAGHFPHHEHPDDVARILAEFLAAEGSGELATVHPLDAAPRAS